MEIKTIASIVGARPQFIKAAPLSRALVPSFREVMIHTGQHYDFAMSDVFFEEMEMKKPDFNLGVAASAHGEQTGRMLIEIEKILASVHPDCVLVYGDTNSTLAGALSAVKAQLPLVHVEAGLRSYNRAMPEEINRVLTDHMSNLLFCPTDTAVKNLAKEGIEKGVYHVGDVMADSFLRDLEMARKRSNILNRLNLEKGRYALATVHRASTTDDKENMSLILQAFGNLPSCVVFPAHPRTRKMMQEWGISVGPNVVMIEPVGRFDMLSLQENANCILTDSGGMQKEAYLAGVRCITLREETEWVETVNAGWNRLVGINVKKILDSFESWFPQAERVPLYGDGHAAEKITEILLSTLK